MLYTKTENCKIIAKIGRNIMQKLKVAIVGFGGIARAHYTGYKILEAENAPVQLVALCDIDAKRFTQHVKINIESEKQSIDESLATYTSVDELIAKADFDMADVCLPSYLHKAFTVKLLKAGKHVLCEKPMALSAADCEEMIATARACGKQLMIGQCLRFNATYAYLKDCVTDGRFGKIRNLYMYRKSAQPRWGFENWFADTARSGGCILDMHIHDIDMARYLLGEPYAVSCLSYDAVTRWSVVNSRLYYKDVMVVADGSWDESDNARFKSGFSARFENAQVTCDGKEVTVTPDHGEAFKPQLPQTNHMAEEIRYFASIILQSKENEKNPPESACATVRLIERLRESAAQDGEIIKL